VRLCPDKLSGRPGCDDRLRRIDSSGLSRPDLFRLEESTMCTARALPIDELERVTDLGHTDNNDVHIADVGLDPAAGVVLDISGDVPALRLFVGVVPPLLRELIAQLTRPDQLGG
jgi:hypothetical protein